MSSGEESENVRIKARGYSIREQVLRERRGTKEKGKSTDNAARQIFTATVSPAVFRDPSIAFSCRVRIGERATKKDHAGWFHSDVSGESADSESGCLPSFMRRVQGG